MSKLRRNGRLGGVVDDLVVDLLTHWILVLSNHTVSRNVLPPNLVDVKTVYRFRSDLLSEFTGLLTTLKYNDGYMLEGMLKETHSSSLLPHHS